MSDFEVRAEKLLQDKGVQPSSGFPASAALRVFSIFEVALILATWPLWWRSSEFPRVALLPVAVPIFVERLLTGLLMVSCASIAWPRKSGNFGDALTRKAAASALLLSLSLIVLNQHRLQPWHWLFVLNLVWFLITSGTAWLALMRHTLCAVYVCSALSRATLQPLNSMTAAIAGQILTMLGVRNPEPQSSTLWWMCLVFTVGELAIGMLLVNCRSRLPGAVGAVVLHLTLLVVLSPLGLNHHAGVLLWNLCLLIIVPLLFWPIKGWSADQPKSASGRVRTMILMTWVFPLSGLFGLADNWPSWQLYSSRPETCVLLIEQRIVGKLPSSLTDHIAAPAPLSDWCVVRLDRWSLEQTGSPVYPEDRFQLALIDAVTKRLAEDDRFEIKISEPDPIFWWRRRETMIPDRAQLQNARSRFLLNATATPAQ